LATIALQRNERISATWFVVAAACFTWWRTDFIRHLWRRNWWRLDDSRATPAERNDDGAILFQRTNGCCLGTILRRLQGRGRGGATLAAQFGYLPGNIVLIAGAAFCGMRAGFCDFVLLDPAKRKIAGRNGTR